MTTVNRGKNDNNQSETASFCYTIPNVERYTLFYAPYSNPIGPVTLNNITVLDFGTKTDLDEPWELLGDTKHYVAVPAANCSGSSDYSN